MMTGTGTPLSKVGVNSHCFRLERGLVEERNRPQHARIAHFSIGAARRFDDYHSLHACGLRNRRVNGTNIFGLRRLLDVATDTNGLGRRGRRWRRSLGNATDNAASDPTRDTAFDAANGFLEPGLDASFRLDFFRRLDGRGRRIDLGRLRLRRRRRWRRRWWWRWWWRSADKR